MDECGADPDTLGMTLAPPLDQLGTGGGPRKATLFQLVFMTYSVICSGAYGLEEMVQASGPGLTLLVLAVLPFIWAAPISLTCA